RLEVAPLEKLHHDERDVPFGPADVEDTRDVVALDLRRRPRFPRETRHDFSARARVATEALQRDTLGERAMTGLQDKTHRALADDRLDTKLAVEHLPHPQGEIDPVLCGAL